MSNQEYLQIGEAELLDDVDNGEHEDELRPVWSGSFFEEEKTLLGYEIKFSSAAFPPGTQIIIKEPVCPKCTQIRSVCATYDCAFDWCEWDENRRR